MYFINLFLIMKVRFHAVLCLLIGVMMAQYSLANLPVQNEPARKVSFNNDWRFHRGDILQAKDSSYKDDDGSWRILNLPHDWSIEGPFRKDNPMSPFGGSLPAGIGWYRKTFTVPAGDEGKLLFIDFDGVYMNSEVWLNGHYLGARPYGYSSFRYELTPYLNYGDQPNIIAVRVDNSVQPNSRWYSGSGIYRNVWLVTTNKIHVDHWGTYVSTPRVNNSEAVVSVETTVRNVFPNDKQVTLTTIIFNKEGREVTRETVRRKISGDSSYIFSQELKVANPDWWSTEKPSLYKAESLVSYDGNIYDKYETSFGIRYFHFDSQKGFFLNGKHLKIRGVCDHHDLGSLGAAVNTRAIERKLQMLKDMGCNAIRTSHNPPAPELLELCDRMGFLVMDEAFDRWQKGHKPSYQLYFDQWHKRDLSDMIRRDRNHPSVIIWSIGNEIPDQWVPSGGNIARELAGIIRSLDTTRPITSAMNDPEKENNSISHSGALDLIGHNYGIDKYKDFFNYFPGGKFIATETTSAFASRGEYDMPSDSTRRWPPLQSGQKMNADLTASAYDNCSSFWGSTHEEAWKVVKDNDFISGMFIWTGFDYLGEPAPYTWPARSSYFGIIDLAGFPKDIYYFYQSEWGNKPVLHIFPHWNWNRGDTIDVWAYYSKADEVELFLNGQSLGKRHKSNGEMHVMWRVPFKPGALKAISTKKGKIVLQREIHTAGIPAKIILQPDRTRIKADGKDLSFVTVKIVDAKGNMVPKADNLVHFDLSGPGVIAGVDNGKQTDHEPFQANYRKAYNGLCLVIIQSKDKDGKITLTATSKGLQTQVISIQGVE